jgi:NAD(P)-dependent dehydrogenase (short-subunit alcohol dehydrogenase family)
MGAGVNLSGRVMLVTGGAHRVGKAIALALAAEGAQVAFTYYSSQEAARQTAGEIEALGVQALALPCDQSDPAQIPATVQAVLERFGRLDGLVNSAAIMSEKPFLEVTLQDWDATLAVNTRGPFFFTQAAAKVMLAGEGGAIVNILDESALSPTRYFVHHSASKAALWMLTRSTALALAPAIRVNAVLPGPVLIPQGWSEERWQRLAATTPLKRLGTPADVARAVAFLMKEDFITGQVIVVDGGRTLTG